MHIILHYSEFAYFLIVFNSITVLFQFITRMTPGRIQKEKGGGGHLKNNRIFKFGLISIYI